MTESIKNKQKNKKIKRLSDIVESSIELQEKLMMVRIYYWLDKFVYEYNGTVDGEDMIAFIMNYVGNEERAIYLSNQFEKYWIKNNFTHCSLCDKLCVDEPICECPDNNGECQGKCGH